MCHDCLFSRGKEELKCVRNWSSEGKDGGDAQDVPNDWEAVSASMFSLPRIESVIRSEQLFTEMWSIIAHIKQWQIIEWLEDICHIQLTVEALSHHVATWSFCTSVVCSKINLLNCPVVW